MRCQDFIPAPPDSFTSLPHHISPTRAPCVVASVGQIACAIAQWRVFLISPFPLAKLVVPTRMGVNQAPPMAVTVSRCRPHTHGDEPVMVIATERGGAESPQARGCADEI